GKGILILQVSPKFEYEAIKDSYTDYQPRFTSG
ncbi:MAG: hypothetical protein RL634_124, partial [Bacteroidota bacterium]